MKSKENDFWFELLGLFQREIEGSQKSGFHSVVDSRDEFTRIKIKKHRLQKKTT